MNWRIARTLTTAYYAYMLEYRAELLLWALSNSLPLIMLGVWSQSAQGGGFVLTAGELERYFLAVFLTRQFNVVWVIWEFEKEVISGQLSHRLLQPIDPAWHHFFSHIAERIARLPLVMILTGLFVLLYPQALWLPHWGDILVLLIVVPLAFTARFLMQYTSAMLAFWTERASALEQLWFLIYLSLSGTLAPLEVIPEPIPSILLWTPFPYLVYFPSMVLVGKMPMVEVGRCIVVLGLWTALFWLVNRYLWQRGLKRYSGMGA
jgi:ABC-2 type transport system permease protein